MKLNLATTQGKASDGPENSLEQQVDEILRRVDTLPTIDPRRVDEILDYDENGLSR